MNASADVIVVGAGVAGISAAVHIAQIGRHVILIEQRKHLGGRAASFEHQIGPGGLLDNCQHVLLGCCTELQRLYRILGVEHLVRFDDIIEFADKAGRRAQMKATILPSPLHLGPSLLGFGLLTLKQKLQIARAMAAMYLAGQNGRESQQGISFAQYLASVGQSAATIRDYWDVICISALNETCADASAKYGVQVFQESFLSHRRGYRLGYALAPLADLYRKLPGVDVRTAAGARSLLLENGRVTGVTLTSGDTLTAHHLVLATSPGNALPMLRPLMHLDPQFQGIEHLQYRSILGAHLLYDRPVPLKRPISMLNTRLQWVFPDERRPELIHGVVSAADLLSETENLAALFDSEIRQAFPEFANLKLIDSLMVREKRATFRPTPGVDAIRPSQRTNIPGLTLAGDYTKTNWPATMEGAARSGRLAAEVVCA